MIDFRDQLVRLLEAVRPRRAASKEHAPKQAEIRSASIRRPRKQLQTPDFDRVQRTAAAPAYELADFCFRLEALRAEMLAQAPYETRQRDSNVYGRPAIATPSILEDEVAAAVRTLADAPFGMRTP